MEDVGVIGAGQMGGAMVRRLRAVGRSVVVYDRNANAMTAAAEAGAEPASSAREVADRVEIVFASLPSVKASIDVANEVVQGSRIKVYVETSTIGRAAVSEIGALVTGRGVGFLDAPVSGGKERVLDGTLTFMVAGAPAHVGLGRKTLDPVTKSVFVVREAPGVG